MVNLPKMEIVISVEVARIEIGSFCMVVYVYETAKWTTQYCQVRYIPIMMFVDVKRLKK